ncbi:MAG: L,D-transpeptidase family protein [Persicimonas sp.]
MTRSSARQEALWLRAALVALLMISLAPAACRSSSDAAPINEASEPRRNQNLDVVDALAASLPQLLGEHAHNEASRLSIDAILEEPKDRLDDVSLERPEYLQTLYAQRDYQPLWVEVNDSTARMRPEAFDLLNTLNEATEIHGLWSDELHLRELNRIELPGRDHLGGGAFAGVTLDEQQRAAVLDWLADSDRNWRANGDLQELLAALLAEGAPLGYLREPMETQIDRLQTLSRESGRVDVLLSDAAVHYALRMRFENPAWQRGKSFPERLQTNEELAESAAKAEADGEDADGDAVADGGTGDDDAGGDEQATAEQTLSDEELEQARRQYMVVEALGPVFEDVTRFEEVFSALPPPFEPYRRLSEAFERYASIVDDGGWPELPNGAEGLKRGAKSEHIPVVKERLRVEGYFDGDDSETFGNDLRRALLTYQRTHQLWENGWLTPQTVRSLDVTAAERWNQIRLSLQRWRESRIGPDQHYVHVNISDFHASVWRDGQREMRFKVIVGSTTRKENDDGEKYYRHATPRFSDQLEYMVFNPYWNIPENIRTKELEPKFEEKPDYFEEKNYEYVTEDSGRTFLRQKPGPTNALGRVKFLFPNRYAVYMHDTPDKKLFDHPFRAYSHGCIRVEEPMELAHYLLDLDGRWKEEKREEKLEEWFEKDGDTWINLRVNLPVHIEYFVVRVDDDGHANFLADLYRLDRPRMAQIAAKIEQLEDTSSETANLERAQEEMTATDDEVDQEVAP